MSYSSVIFDMDGVLLDLEADGIEWKYEAVRRAVEQLGVDISKLGQEEIDGLLGDRGEQAFREVVNEYGLEAAVVWQAVADATSEARKQKIREGGFRLFPESEEVLRNLRKNSVATGMVSNAPEAAVRYTVEGFSLKQLLKFYRGVDSFEDFHHRKPHPDHLQLARAELKRSPFLYVGDRESDVEAALNAGMDAAWINRNGETIHEEPDYTFENLKGLESMLVQQ